MAANFQTRKEEEIGKNVLGYEFSIEATNNIAL